MGVDVAAVALEEARKRAGGGGRGPNSNANAKRFRFVESDMADKRLLSHPAVAGTVFDVVSVQFRCVFYI